jgi:cytidine deaminase
VAEEGPEMKIAMLAVIALGHEFPPCGACRQVIAEFAGPETAVWFLRDGKPFAMTMAELLPAGFRI